jgi:hypothetical protein
MFPLKKKQSYTYLMIKGLLLANRYDSRDDTPACIVEYFICSSLVNSDGKFPEIYNLEIFPAKISEIFPEI